MESQSQNFRETGKSANPLRDIAANLGVTPKVLTQLATGDDSEFRELVRGIFSILPEDEVLLVASDAEINSEFLDYLCHIFEKNRKVLLTIFQNPACGHKTRRYILENLPKDVVIPLLNRPELSLDAKQLISRRYGNIEEPDRPQTEEFKIKMKVSRLLNDLEANLGVTIEAFLKIRSKNDTESQEFVREVYNALPEENVLLVSRDSHTNPTILDYLSRLFDNNQRVLITILVNPTTSKTTKVFILNALSEKTALALAENPEVPPAVLRLMGEHFTDSEDIQVALLANPATPLDAKESIQALSDGAVILDAEELPPLEGEYNHDEALSDMSGNLFKELLEEDAYQGDDVDAKITLCVDKLYDINAEIVTEFIKKARAEIVKRLKLMAKVNRVVLSTIVKHENLSIEELEAINLDMFASLLKKSPKEIDEQAVLKILHHAKQKKTH